MKGPDDGGGNEDATRQGEQGVRGHWEEAGLYTCNNSTGGEGVATGEREREGGGERERR